MGHIFCVMLIDHENIDFKKNDLIFIIKNWLLKLLEKEDLTQIIDLKVRAYGGWFFKQFTTEQRFIASSFYQDNLPTAFYIDKHLCKLYFEFADSLIDYNKDRKISPIKIDHTVSYRSKPLSFSRNPNSPKCSDHNCRIKEIQKWLKKQSACSYSNCQYKFSTFFNRKEQKQVDVHLATDLLILSFLSLSETNISILSDDMDLIPALLAASYFGNDTNKLTLIKCTNSSEHLTDVLNCAKINLLECI